MELMALITGVISTCSSTSGVVLPAFLPTIPSLLQQIGGGDPLALARASMSDRHWSMFPPLNPGAMCIAAVQNQEDSRRLFHQLFIWGLDDHRWGNHLPALRRLVCARLILANSTPSHRPGRRMKFPDISLYLLQILKVQSVYRSGSRRFQNV
jgi:hypothetical protein